MNKFGNFGLTEQQANLVNTVSALAQGKFAGRAARYDAESSFPVENYQDLRDTGLLALTVPAQYGGLAADPVTFALCILEMSRGCPATALTFNMHANVIASFLDELATEEQKRFYYGEVVNNGATFASITSEPDSSFREQFVMRTRFTPLAGGYRVHGTKHFCSLGDAADYYFVSGLVDGSTFARDGIISAMIPRDGSGIEVTDRWDATGMRGTTSHTIKYDAIVQPSQVIGSSGRLLSADFSGFALGYAAVYLGVAQAAFDYITDYAKKRVIAPATEPISHHPMTQRSIGEMATQVRAATLMLVDAAKTRQSGDREAATLAVNQAKYLAAEVSVAVTTQAMRLAGGGGILKNTPLERWHRDSLAGPVMPPSNDRCLETIGKIICGLRATTLEIQ